MLRLSSRKGWTSCLAALLIVAMPGLLLPVHAQPAAASLSGTVQSAGDRAPLAGVRVFAGDRATGEVFRSEPTSEDGRFAIRGLPAASYELAVGVDEGLYLVETPVPLAPGTGRRVTLAVDAESRINAQDDPSDITGDGPSLWNNPVTAALIVFGVAVVIGIIVENATDDEDDGDEDDASPF